MSDKDTITRLRLALAGAVGALEACEQILRLQGHNRTAAFCEERIAEYTEVLADSKPTAESP